MMLEMMHGYPMPRTPVQVRYDGAVWFFYQEGDDEKIVMADKSVDGLLLWLRLASDAKDEAPAVPVLEISGGRFPGIVEQSPVVASWVREPGAVYPAIRLTQGQDFIEFDADEGKFLAAILETNAPRAVPRPLTTAERRAYALSKLFKVKETMNQTFGKYGLKMKPVTKEDVRAAEQSLAHRPRLSSPQNALVHCPRCLAAQGKLIDCPAGQNEVRCSVCEFVFQFRYTPDMTEGT